MQIPTIIYCALSMFGKVVQPLPIHLSIRKTCWSHLAVLKNVWNPQELHKTAQLMRANVLFAIYAFPLATWGWTTLSVVLEDMRNLSIADGFSRLLTLRMQQEWHELWPGSIAFQINIYAKNTRPLKHVLLCFYCFNEWFCDCQKPPKYHTDSH